MFYPVVTILYCAINFFVTTAEAAPVNGQGTWQTTLQARDLDGNPATTEAYYDTVLNITWLADANNSIASSFDDGYSHSDGLMTWGNANAWAANLAIGNYSDWRLPNIVDIADDGCNFAYTGTDCGYNVLTADNATVYSEMASLFYETLGNLSYRDTLGNPEQPGWGLTNSGPFVNLNDQVHTYWSFTEFSPFTLGAWHFSFRFGGQGASIKTANYFAWAVHDNDIGSPVTLATPLPAALWLFGSGLAGLLFPALVKSKPRKRVVHNRLEFT